MTAPSLNNNTRNQYFDFLRGVAIIMVVGIHTYSLSSGFFSSLEDRVSVVIRQLLNCAVPLFFAISSFFLSGKDLSDRNRREAFWHHQILKVYIPALVWGAPWLILACLDTGISLKNILLWLLCGFSVLYFVSVIIQFYVLLPFLTWQRTTFLVAMSAIVSFFSIVLVTYLRVFSGLHLPLILYAGNCLLWMVFYALGIALSRGDRMYKLWPWIVCLIVSLALSVFESFFFASKEVLVGIKPSSFLFSSVALLVLFSKKVENAVMANKGFVFNVIVFLGSISFGVYLSHMVIYRVLKYLCHIDIWYLRWLVVLLLDVMFVMVLKKFLPIRINKILGI